MTITLKFDPSNNQKILDKLEERIDIKAASFAATPWQKYHGPINTIMIRPHIGEWCLWSMEIQGKRNYFSGRLVEHDGEMYARWGNRSYKINDTLYYARVNKMIFENEQIYMTGNKVFDLNEVD